MNKLPKNKQEETTVLLSEAELDFLEQQIPDQAAAATQAAFWATLTRGDSVLCTQGKELYEISPDGSRQLVKTLPDNLSLPIGTTIILRK